MKNINNINTLTNESLAAMMSEFEIKKAIELFSDLDSFLVSQNMNITRKELEQKNQYKDLDVLEDTVGIKKYRGGSSAETQACSVCRWCTS